MARKIVAIVGKTHATRDVLAQALEIGRAIVAEGGIVLTGGEPDGGGDSVKELAQRGAMSCATNSPNNLVGIGVLPRRQRPALSLDSGSGGKFFRIETKLQSEERNPLSAAISGAMLALQGGGGTVAEIVFALFWNKPVYFLESPLGERWLTDDLIKEASGAIEKGRQKWGLPVLAIANATQSLRGLASSASRWLSVQTVDQIVVRSADPVSLGSALAFVNGDSSVPDCALIEKQLGDLLKD